VRLLIFLALTGGGARGRPGPRHERRGKPVPGRWTEREADPRVGGDRGRIRDREGVARETLQGAILSEYSWIRVNRGESPFSP
jgi:hypothetical protein